MTLIRGADTTGGNFDAAFHFSGRNHDINGDETSVYTLTGSGLTAGSFRFVSVPSRSGGSKNEDGHGESAWISGSEFYSTLQNQRVIQCS